jgi:hypothetical protein
LAFSVISRRRCSQRDRRSPNALEALADEMGVLVIEARRALAIDLGQRRSDGVADTEALKEAESGAHNLFNLRVFISLGKAAMDHSEARDFKSRFRRYDAKRRRVEAAVEGLVHRYGLPSDTARALNDWIYRLYRILLVLKSLDDQDRYYREWKHPARDLAERTANARDTEISAYVANAREFAAHMIRLETLEGRNLGRGKAIEQASKTTWDELSPKEKRKARLYLKNNVLPGDRTRRPAREVVFLRSVARLIEQTTGHPISFSSAALASKVGSSGRHHGAEFDVMMAAAKMADYRLSNEAMARRIQRIRRQ